MLITRRQSLGFLATVLLAGCAEPEAPIPPLPMGPPLDKEMSADHESHAHVADVPPHFQVKFETTKGDFIVEVHSHWSSNGAVHFYELVKNGFYNDCRFFRVVPGFMVQWGINGDPTVDRKWKDANIPDDRPTGDNKKSNLRGFITYAMTGAPNSRSTQLYINYADNSGSLDARGFTPFGQVIEGMEVVDAINAEHRELPDQAQIHERGNDYLDEKFPSLDYIKKATFVESAESPTESPKNEDAVKGDEKL